jgi:hypothetical protein
MSALRRVTTRPEKKAEVVTNSLRPDSREIPASLNLTVDLASESLPVFDPGLRGVRPYGEPWLRILLLDQAHNSRLSLRLT